MFIYKQSLSFNKQIMLFFAPLFASLTITVSPSLAATFASSIADVSITNLSHNPGLDPDDILVETDTDSVAIFEKGNVNVDAQAVASFITEPDPNSSYIANTTFTFAEADAEKYLVSGKSIANIIGYNFLIKAGEIFSFDLESILGLVAAEIDSSISESASANGEILLEIYDQTTNTTLDYLKIMGNLSTLLDDDSITFEFSEKFTITKNESSSSFGGTEEFASIEINGKYSRLFNQDTVLTLQEIKKSQVTVKTPEPSSQLSLLVLGLLAVGFASKLKPSRKIQPEILSGCKRELI